MTTLRILIVDDHLLIRSGLRSLLVGVPDIEIVAEAATAQVPRRRWH